MASETFASLRKALTKGRLLLPGDDGYEQSLNRWSSTCIIPAVSKRPSPSVCHGKSPTYFFSKAAVAQPRTAEEASSIVKFATANGIAFNVKGGGHSTSAASSAPSPEGMVLDLSLMRDVSVDVQAQTVSFGGGCLWGDVDKALWEHGLATTGGTVSHTGVGGLILHGGYGYLSGLHGLTVDLLLSCEVILADGSIVTASETENPDLFWAMRGAGSSFGVVTKFTSKAFVQGPIWAGVFVFSVDKLPALVEFVNTWGETNDGRQVLSLACGHAPPAPDNLTAPRPKAIIMQMVHLGDNAEVLGPEYFAPMLKLDYMHKMAGPMPYSSINTIGDEDLFPPGRKYLLGGANFTLPLTLATAEAILDKFWGFGDDHPQDMGMQGSVCLFECLSRHKSSTVSSSATAFNNRGNYYNIILVHNWEDAAHDSEVRLFNRQLQKDIRSLGYNNDKLDDGVGMYINYASPDVVVNAETAFGSNAQRLKDVKAIYDPANVFNKAWKLAKKQAM